MNNIEKKVRDYYENIWSLPIKLEGRDENLLLGFHYGFYEKDIKNWKEAAINMNDFVGRLLGLDNNKTMQILDAGCGVGATLVYLAQKYPNVTFTGITLAPAEVALATKLQKEKNVKNTKFILRSYIKTGFPNNYFDGVFALESMSYAQNKEDFIDETNRVLKASGKLIVLDGFRTEKPLSSLMQKLYDSFLKRRAVPYLISIETFRSYLEIGGFKEITIRDLSKNGIIRNFLQKDFFRLISNYLILQFNRSIRSRKYESTKDVDYILSSLVPEFILGLSKRIGYYAIIAIKK